LKHKRCAAAFEKGSQLLDFLKKKEADGDIEVHFFDEVGFTQSPVVPYAWQPIGDTLRLPSSPSKRLNVLGFINRDNDYFGQTKEGAVSSEDVIEAFDAFAKRFETTYLQTGKVAVIVLDNAPVHRSNAFMAKIDDGLLSGVVLHFIPPYCPELNLIEILWRKIKYEWLPLGAYETYQTLKETVLSTLEEIGHQYAITFA
jgi:transposase